jgi:hypothetical protein
LVSSCKTCTRCKTDKPLTEFHKRKKSKDGLQPLCKPCAIEKNHDYYSYEAHRRHWLKKRYGLSIEQYNTLLDSQNGLCAVCQSKNADGRWDTFAVDHDHSTGLVRGLLCNGCNRAIGFMDDNPERLESAAAYLRKHHGE